MGEASFFYSLRIRRVHGLFQKLILLALILLVAIVNCALILVALILLTLFLNTLILLAFLLFALTLLSRSFYLRSILLLLNHCYCSFCLHFFFSFYFLTSWKNRGINLQFRLNFCKNEFFCFTMIYCLELKLMHSRLVTLEYKRAFAIFLLLRWISFSFAHRSPSTCVPSSVCCDSWRKISNINRKIRREMRGSEKECGVHHHFERVWKNIFNLTFKRRWNYNL